MWLPDKTWVTGVGEAVSTRGAIKLAFELQIESSLKANLIAFLQAHARIEKY